MTNITIVFGSVFGAAEELANMAQNKLSQLGFNASIVNGLEVGQVGEITHLLVISSSTGRGDIPDNLGPLVYDIDDLGANLSHLNYAVIALGDSSYFDSFCGAGVQIDKVLAQQGAKPVLEMLKVDACEHFNAWDVAEGYLDNYSKKLSEVVN